jgi:hypothetical protein
VTEYTASVRREGKWWMVDVPAIDGATQARRLSEAELMARELIAVTLDVPIDQVSVVVTIETIGGLDDLADRIAGIAARREQAASLDKQATRDAAELAKALVELDIPLRDVGTVLGVSHQRAHQLVADLRGSGRGTMSTDDILGMTREHDRD